MKQKTITLYYDEVWMLYTEARINDVRFYETDYDGTPWYIPGQDKFDDELLALYDKLKKKYNW